MSIHETHMIWNEQSYDVQAACSCGWRGDVVSADLSADADAQAIAHEETA